MSFSHLYSLWATPKIDRTMWTPGMYGQKASLTFWNNFSILLGILTCLYLCYTCSEAVSEFFGPRLWWVRLQVASGHKIAKLMAVGWVVMSCLCIISVGVYSWNLYVYYVYIYTYYMDKYSSLDNTHKHNLYIYIHILSIKIYLDDIVRMIHIYT